MIIHIAVCQSILFGKIEHKNTWTVNGIGYVDYMDIYVILYNFTACSHLQLVTSWCFVTDPHGTTRCRKCTRCGVKQGVERIQCITESCTQVSDEHMIL